MKKMKKINISLYLMVILSFNVFGETPDTWCKNFLSYDYRNDNLNFKVGVLLNNFLSCNLRFKKNNLDGNEINYFINLELNLSNIEYYENNYNVDIVIAESYNNTVKNENRIKYFEKNLIEYISKYNELKPLETIKEFNEIHKIINTEAPVDSINGCYY